MERGACEYDEFAGRHELFFLTGIHPFFLSVCLSVCLSLSSLACLLMMTIVSYVIALVLTRCTCSIPCFYLFWGGCVAFSPPYDPRYCSPPSVEFWNTNTISWSCGSFSFSFPVRRKDTSVVVNAVRGGMTSLAVANRAAQHGVRTILHASFTPNRGPGLRDNKINTVAKRKNRVPSAERVLIIRYTHVVTAKWS